MNLFFVHGSGQHARLVTPELTGTLLPGVVRDSVLTLAREMCMPIEQRPVLFEDWRSGIVDGTITETFACGTAAVVTAVGTVRSAAGEWTIGDQTEGPVTRRLREALLDVQHGSAADPHNWMYSVC